MTRLQADFLRECMSEFGPVPIDEFNRTFCVVCANRDCSRSGGNNSQFDHRVASWQSNLFTQVPRASDGDSNYDHIRAKKFLPVDRLPDVNMSPPKFEVISPGGTFPPIQQIMPVTLVTPPKEVQIETPGIPGPVPEQEHLPDNTPFTQGTVLPKQSGEVVIQPGGSYSFDSDE